MEHISRLKLSEPREKVDGHIVAKYENGYTVISTFSDNGRSIEDHLKDLLKIKTK